MDQKDFAGALTATLRIMELELSVNACAMAINLLYVLKEGAMGDAAMNKVLNEIIGPNNPKARLEFAKAFVRVAAVEWAVHAKAHDIAEEVLKQDPQDTAALRVRAHRLAPEGRHEEAGNVMKRVHKLETQPAATAPAAPSK